ncbi:MAG TPA: glycosyltransferase [Dongiaceae bacterium]|jgi:glycosyltransferase involved in cell wall biosynthesis|nr:glycosyltransferase [Dongiaceae bacterium]
MRLLFASPFPYWPDNTSGRETSAHALTLRLQARGVPVAVFAGTLKTAPGESPRPAIARDETLGYPVFRAREPLLAYDAVLAEFRPDVAILPFHEPVMPLAALGIHAGARAALLVTSVDAHAARLNLIQRPEIMLMACSPFAARRMEALHGFRPPVTLPLVEPELYRVAPRGDAVVMVNPTLMKGVEIFFRLAEARPDRRFIAIESWDITDEWRLTLANRARALGNVELWPSAADMRPAYARARLVLMPSIHEETYGRIVAEAQVSGIPALCADRGALPETGGAGALYVDIDAPIGDWLAALDRMWDEPAHRALSAAARREAERPERRPEAIVDGLLEVLAAFAAGRS